MNISSDLILGIAIGAASLFAGVFIVSAILTFRNRKIVRRFGQPD